MPSSSPIITLPIARPRSLSVTRSGAIGSTIWVTDASAPRTTLDTTSQVRFGDTATRQGKGHRGVHPKHQGAALQHVSQRYEREQPGGVAHLCRYGDKAGVAGSGSKAPPHVHEQGLVEVDGGHTNRAGQAEEVQRSTRCGGLWPGGHSLICEH